MTDDPRPEERPGAADSTSPPLGEATAAGDDPGSAPRTATLPPPPHRPLVRPLDDRVFRGVCAAIGRATGTDPVLWRVLVVVLALFGGSGLVLYLAGWLLIPEEGQAESEGQKLAHGHGVSTGVAIALGIVAVLVVVPALTDGRGLVPLAVVALLAFLVLRNGGPGRREAPPAPPPTGAQAWDAPPAWSAPAWQDAPVSWGPPPPVAGAPPPPPRRPRSVLGPLTVSLVALAVGALLLAGALGVDGVSAPLVLAVALLVTGLGLLVGARWGRARGLIALAAVLALALGAVTSADRRFGDDAGDRTWAVTGSAEHRLGAGSATLDLRPLDGTARRDLTVTGRLGAGELVVLVPEDLRVDLDADVGVGELVVPDASDGSPVTMNGPGLSRDVTFGPGGRVDVELDVQVGLGRLEVRVVQ